MRQEKLNELKKYVDEFSYQSSKPVDGESKFISVKGYEFNLKNGMKIYREGIFKNNKSGNAVIIVPLTDENEIILVVQPRPFTKNKVSLEVPAGYIDDGENFITAGLRELREETGYASTKVKFLSKYYQDQGCSSALNYSLLALDCKKIFEQDLDSDEYIKYFKCSFLEALEFVEMGYICDANSIIALEKAKKYVK